MRKKIIGLMLGGAVLASSAGTRMPLAAQERETAHRPNILLIITDDVGLDMVTGMYPGLIDRLTRQYGPKGRGNPGYANIDGRPASTPVLDRFARQGMVFTDAWAQPFCSPTRASMLTGLYAGKTNVITYADALDQNHDSFVRRLREDAGYATAVFGKWHMAGLPGNAGEADYPGMKPKEAGFELFRGNMHAALPTYWDYEVQIQDDATGPGEWREEAASQRSLPGIAPTPYAAVAKGADTIRWIEQRERDDPDKPWFAWVAFNLAHATINQQPSAMMIPNKDTLDAATIAEVEACGGEFGTQNTGDCSGEAQMRAMTNSMDTIIGRILEVIERQAPDTYVIIVGDNGTPMYGRPKLDFIDNMYITRTERGKGTAFESGARVEFAVRGPGIAQSSSSHEFVHVVDLYSTILDLAGLEAPTVVSDSSGKGTVALDSISLKPILDGQKDTVRDPVSDVILTESSNLMKQGIYVAGARNLRWKLVCTDNARHCEFYDLLNDPLEEYPLKQPGQCNTDLDVQPVGNADWNFCFLQQYVATNSILKGK